MAGSFGGIPRLILPAGEENVDPLHAIASRLFPLVRSRPDWWREAVRRWESDPPQYCDCPAVALYAKQSMQREKGESSEAWKERCKTIKRAKEQAKDVHYEIIPVPFPEEELKEIDRIALLAAIHDTYATIDAKIDPWTKSGALTEVQHTTVLAWWVLLRDRISTLREHWDTHEAAIEVFLADVERRLNPGEAVWLGNSRVQVDGKIISLEAQFSDVIEALVTLRTATRPQLETRSGRQGPDRLLKKLVMRFPELKPHIRFPGGRGRGGYGTTIKNGAN